METPLLPGIYYHIFNRGNNRENLFHEPRNYAYFLTLYNRYTSRLVETCAYCLLKNHFHLLIRVRESVVGNQASQGFSNFFNAYARAYNRAYGRTGTLFQRPFKRIPVVKSTHFLSLVAYIHVNPQKHGFSGDYRDWPYSSYKGFFFEGPSFLCREHVLNAFGGTDGFLDYHSTYSDRESEMQAELEFETE